MDELGRSIPNQIGLINTAQNLDAELKIMHTTKSPTIHFVRQKCMHYPDFNFNMTWSFSRMAEPTH